MNKEFHNKIISPGDCISEQTLFDYIDNKLTQKERHVVEKHLLDCELCSDALEGLEMVKDRGRISLIKEEVNKRILAGTKDEAKVIAFNYKVVLSIAATIALLIVGVFLFKQMSLKEATMKGDMAQLNENEGSPSNIPPPPPPASVDKTAVAPTLEPTEATGESVETVSGFSSTITEEDVKAAPNKVVVDQEVFAAEQQQPGANYKGDISNSGAVAADEIAVAPSFGTTVKDVPLNNVDDKKYDQLEKAPAAPKSTGTYDYDKESKLEQGKKAEDKAAAGSGSASYSWSSPDGNTKNNESGNKQQSTESRTTTTTITANATAVTKKSETVELSKEADKGKAKDGVYRSENKPAEIANGKTKKSAQSKNREGAAEDNYGGVVGYEPESVIKEKEKLKEQEEQNDVALDVARADSVSFQNVLVTEEAPEYPGGDAALNKFIAANFKYDKDQFKSSPPASNKIYVQFTVAADGSINDAKVIKGINATLDSEALRVVKLMPKWKPVQKNGKPISTVVNLPIKLEFK